MYLVPLQLFHYPSIVLEYGKRLVAVCATLLWDLDSPTGLN